MIVPTSPSASATKQTFELSFETSSAAAPRWARSSPQVSSDLDRRVGQLGLADDVERFEDRGQPGLVV